MGFCEDTMTFDLQNQIHPWVQVDICARVKETQSAIEILCSQDRDGSMLWVMNQFNVSVFWSATLMIWFPFSTIWGKKCSQKLHSSYLTANNMQKS